MITGAAVGAGGGLGPGAPTAEGPGRSPVVARNFQPQLRHQQPHHVVAAAMQLQGGQVVLRSPLRATAEPAAGSSPEWQRGLLPGTWQGLGPIRLQSLGSHLANPAPRALSHLQVHDIQLGPAWRGLAHAPEPWVFFQNLPQSTQDQHGHRHTQL